MKHIVKGLEPDEFKKWKELANEEWQPTYSSMGSSLKNCVKDSLMQEQGFICCYCERRLTVEDSHIEHFKPQSDDSVDSLDYSNLLCSCQNRLNQGEPRHCGNLKGDWFDINLLISPLDPDCENPFSFKGDGRIEPVDSDDAAVETIKNLGLAIPKLNALRKNAIEPFLDDSLEPQDFNRFVDAYLNTDHTGKFGEFHMTIKDLFG